MFAKRCQTSHCNLGDLSLKAKTSKAIPPCSRLVRHHRPFSQASRLQRMNNLGNSRCVVKTGKCIKCRFSTVFFSCSLRMRCLPCAFVLGKAAFSRKRVLAKKHASFRLFWRFSTCFATFAQRAQPAQPALEEVKTPIVEDEDWSEDQEKAAGVKETLKFSVLGNENALGMVTRPSKDSPGEEPKRSEIWL